MLTVSHQKSRIFLPLIPGSKALGTPVRWLYKPVSSFWERRSKVTEECNRNAETKAKPSIAITLVFKKRFFKRNILKRYIYKSYK